MHAVAQFLDQILFGSYELRSLAAQETTALWTMLMAVFTGGAVVGSGVAAIFAYRSFKLSQLVHSITNTAYVHPIGLRYGESGQNLVITIKNSGTTPATHVAVQAEAKFVKKDEITQSIDFRNTDFKIWSNIGPSEKQDKNILDDDPVVASFAAILHPPTGHTC